MSNKRPGVKGKARKARDHAHARHEQLSRARFTYVPCTPAGTPIMDLASKTEQEAWAKLLKAAAHMPYEGVQGFKARGYTIAHWKEP